MNEPKGDQIQGNKSQGRCSKFSLFSPSLVSGITIRTGSNNSVPGRISGVSINLGLHLHNLIMFLYFKQIRLPFWPLFFPF